MRFRWLVAAVVIWGAFQAFEAPAGVELLPGTTLEADEETVKAIPARSEVARGKIAIDSWYGEIH